MKPMRGVRSVSESERISHCDHLTLFMLSTVNTTVNTTMVWGAQPCVGGEGGRERGVQHIVNNTDSSNSGAYV